MICENFKRNLTGFCWNSSCRFGWVRGVKMSCSHGDVISISFKGVGNKWIRRVSYESGKHCGIVSIVSQIWECFVVFDSKIGNLGLFFDFLTI